MNARSEVSPHEDKIVCPDEGFLFLRAKGGYSNSQKTNL